MSSARTTAQVAVLAGDGPAGLDDVAAALAALDDVWSASLLVAASAAPAALDPAAPGDPAGVLRVPPAAPGVAVHGPAADGAVVVTLEAGDAALADQALGTLAAVLGTHDGPTSQDVLEQAVLRASAGWTEQDRAAVAATPQLRPVRGAGWLDLWRPEAGARTLGAGVDAALDRLAAAGVRLELLDDAAAPPPDVTPATRSAKKASKDATKKGSKKSSKDATKNSTKPAKNKSKKA